MYKEAVPLTQDMDMATVGRKIAEIKGHLDAIVDNPQLLKRWTHSELAKLVWW